MGWFSKFRTGRTSAKKASAAANELAKKLGYEHLGVQKGFGQEIQDMTAPGIGYGQDASAQIAGFYNSPEGQQQFVNQAQQSPFYQSMLDQGEQAILRNQMVTGGVRGGSTNQALAQNSQGVLNSIIQQRLSGLSGMADYGMQNQANYLNSMGQNINQQGQTLSGITGASLSHAGILSNAAAGMTGLYGGLLSAGIGAAGSVMGKPTAKKVA